MVFKKLDIDFLFFGGFFGVLVVFFGGLFSFFVVGGGDFKEIIGLFGQLLFGGGGGFFFLFFGLVVNVDIQFVVFKKDNRKLFSWFGVGQKLFNQEEGEEDGEEVIQGDDFYFELVVFFFDLVEVKIGNFLIYFYLFIVIIRCCI